MHLTSIQVLSDLHPGPKIRIWPPCMLHLTFIWISPPARSQELHFHPGPIPPTSRSPDVSHLQLGPVSLPSRSQYPRLISIQVTSQLPSRSRQLRITSIQVPSHHQPRPDIHVSSPARSRYLRLTIQVTSHPIYIPQIASQLQPGPISSHPDPKVCVSPPSRPLFTPIHISKFASHLHPGSISSAPRSQDFISPLCHVSSPFKSPGLHLACIQVPSHSIQVPKFVSRLYAGHISSPPIRVTSPLRSHLGSIQVLIQVLRIASQLHPSPISPHPRQKTCVSSPSKYHLTCIRVPGFTSHSHLLLCHVSPPFRSQESRLSSIHVRSHFIHLLNFICDSPPSRLCLTSIQNLTQMHKVPNMHLSPPSMLRLTSILVMRTASHPPPGLQMCVSPQSRSRLSYVQILIFVSHLDTGRISPPLRPWELHLSFIQVPSHPIPCVEICVSPLSMSCLTSIQVNRATWLLHLGPVSPPFKSLDSYFTSNLLCPGLENFISSPYRSHLTPKHISKRASYDYSGFVRPLSRSEDSCLTSCQVSPSRLCLTSMCVPRISSTLVSDSHLSPPGALQSRRASLQWT